MSDWQEIVDAALERHKDGGSRLASLVLSADDHVGELEAKLAKAVETLEDIRDIAVFSEDVEFYEMLASKCLNELKGETDD